MSFLRHEIPNVSSDKIGYTIVKFITWLVNSALNCTRKPISHESRSNQRALQKAISKSTVKTVTLLANKKQGQSYTNWVQKLEIKLIDRKVLKEKLTDGQSNLLFSNQAHALDGAIHGAIFPWLRDTRAFLLLNHLEVFSYVLLISNHKIFLVQFGINKHS